MNGAAYCRNLLPWDGGRRGYSPPASCCSVAAWLTVSQPWADERADARLVDTDNSPALRRYEAWNQLLEPSAQRRGEPVDHGVRCAGRSARYAADP